MSVRQSFSGMRLCRPDYAGMSALYKLDRLTLATLYPRDLGERLTTSVRSGRFSGPFATLAG
ncbi:hypothetical protein MPL3365_20127 [Mesorhizobium plurifarium]|uniref:Uncharacterized protein n=1 Tax=Mesorhizobium plurifarium TaxID=69974 RepID=A0A090G1Z5_MESPL|nr:hypothetical protein MPL3365_20127 [Mesorhizobium plurifarium]